MKKIIFTILVSVLAGCLSEVLAANYGEHRLFGHFTFDGDAADRLGNIAATPTSLSLEFDSELGMNVMSFSAGDKGNLRLDTYPMAPSMTLALWFRRTDLKAEDTWRYIFAAYGTGKNSFFITPRTGWGDETFVVVDNRDYGDYKSVRMQDAGLGKWVHIAAVFDGNVVKAYMDGRLCGSARMVCDITTMQSTRHYFGNFPEKNANMSGSIGDIRIYHEALASNQIAAIAAGEPLPEPVEEPEFDLLPDTGNTIGLTLFPDEEHQTVRNFGGSDAWSGQYIGKYFSKERLEALAEDLFSTEFDENGNPKGIGLTAWRFHIGCGSAEQGDASKIKDETRRSECFLNSDGVTYDWTKQAGHQNILRLAVEKYGVPDIIGWQNVPPVCWTKNNLAFRLPTDPKASILKTGHYDDMGRFLADFVEHFDAEGLHFSYLSLVNEPQFDWVMNSDTGYGKEGSPWTNAEISRLATAVDAEFTRRGISGTKLFVTESGNISYLLESSAGRGIASDQIRTLWGDGNLSIAGLPSVSGIVSSHSYWNDISAESIVNIRKQLRKELAAQNRGLEYWQTEYSFLGEGYRFGWTSEQLSSMECALSLARVVHADLALADATGWQWWTTFELEQNCRAEDRFSLLRVAMKSDWSGGIYSPTKMFYGFGNFSRFIRPGMIRIGLQRSDGMSDLEAVTAQMFSAYKNPTDGSVTVVAINATDAPVGISLPEIPSEGGKAVGTYIPYVTSYRNTDNLTRYAELAASERFVLPARSIVTFTGIPDEGSGVESVRTETSGAPGVTARTGDGAIIATATAPVTAYVLYDMSGTALRSGGACGTEFRIPAEGLKNGIYLLSTSFGHTSAVNRVIVRN